jgi:hypothetical protein
MGIMGWAGLLTAQKPGTNPLVNRYPQKAQNNVTGSQLFFFFFVEENTIQLFLSFHRDCLLFSY